MEVELSAPAVEEEITVEKEGTENKCTRCGRNGHTVEKCYAKTRSDGTKLTSDAVVEAPQRKKSTASNDKKYITVCRNGKFFRIQNKNYVAPSGASGEVKKKYTPPNKVISAQSKFVDNSWWSYVPSCTIF